MSKASVRFVEDEGPTCFTVFDGTQELGHLCQQDSGRWAFGYDCGRLASFTDWQEAKTVLTTRTKAFR